MENGQHQRTVMVVDDHRFSRMVLTRILQAADYRVLTVENGEQALKVLLDQQPDAFVLDVDMPTMGGIELCQRLREQPRFRMTPILMVTAEEDPAVFRRAFAVGCDDFVDKPLSPLVVTARLGGLLKKYDYFRELERVRVNLARYISPRVRQMIERSTGDEGLPPPEEREVCILFSDIRGFTSLSQKLEPATLFANVSRQLGAQVDAVYRNRGYVDKFGGDGIMAVFDGDSMAWDACRCALEIMRAATEPREGETPMPLGIGIHQGWVVAGNIGSGEHLDYSIIGNTVNLAARLCGYAHSQDVVVSEQVKTAVGEDPRFQFIDPRLARIRGVMEPVQIYRLAYKASPRVLGMARG
jgi:adenylate cyclase